MSPPPEQLGSAAAQPLPRRCPLSCRSRSAFSLPLWTPAGLGRNGIGAAGAEGDAPGGEKMRPEMGSSPAGAGRTSCSACRPVQGWTRLLAGFPKLTVLPVDTRGETPKKTPSGLSEGEEARPVRVLAYFSSNSRGR